MQHAMGTLENASAQVCHHHSLKRQQPWAQLEHVQGGECISIHRATRPIAQTADCALKATSAWHCPGALSKSKEFRFSTMMTWICWCLSCALCTGCQAEDLCTVLHCLAETFCQLPCSVYCCLYTYSKQGFPAPPGVCQTQQKFGFTCLLYRSVSTSCLYDAVKTEFGANFM